MGKWFHRKGAEESRASGCEQGSQEPGWRRREAGGRVEAGAVHGQCRKWTRSRGQEAGGPSGGGKPGLEPQGQEVSEERWLVGCFGSAFRNTPVVWLQHSKT